MDALHFVVAASTLMAAAIAITWRWPSVVFARPRLLLAGVAVLTLASLAVLIRPDPFGVRLRLDPSEEPLLPAGDPARDAYRDAILTFGDDDVLVIAMETDDVFRAGHLGALQRLIGEIRRLPGVRATESLLDATAFHYERADDLISVEKFIDEIPSDATGLAALRSRALADRIYTRTIVSRDGRVAAINVSFRTMTDDEFVAAGIDDSIRALLERESAPGRRFYLTGRQHVKARASSLMLHDVLRLIPLAVVVGTAVGWLVMGSFRNAAIPVGASLIATVWTFAALSAIGGTLNLVTIVLGPMLICIGSISDMHVLARYDSLARKLGDAPAAAAACLNETILPVGIATTTTIIGFAALLVAPQPAIHEFALYSILGVGAMALLSVTAMPALLALLPAPERSRENDDGRTDHQSADALDRFLVWTATLATQRATPVLIGWVIATALCVAAIPSIVADTDYLTFFDERSDVRRDFTAINGLLVGALPVYVTVAGPGEGAFREPANLQALARLQHEVDATPGVDASLSINDYLAVMNRAVEHDDPASERLPATREQAADLMFLLPKNKIRRFVNANHSSVNLLVRTSESGSEAIGELESQLEAAIGRAALPPGLAAVVTGNTIVFNQASNSIAGNQLASMILAAAPIFVLMVVAFRSVRVGLVSMAPNAVPVVMFFGLLGMGLAPLSLPTSLIGSVALGIAIDDTAHFIVNYQRHRGTLLDPALAAAEAVRDLGRPIVTTSLMLSAGYLVLMLSEFATLRQFGWLSALTMQICLWGDLLMLPALLVRARV